MSSESCKRTCNDSTQTHPMFTAITRSNWPSKALLSLAVQSLSLLSVMALTRDRHHHHPDTATDSRQQARCKVLSMATDAEHVRLRRRDSATQLSSLRWPRTGSNSRTFHGSFPPRIILLVDLDSVARAEPDVWNRHTMEPGSKMTEDGLQASRALSILLISTANPSHSGPIATSIGG
jgi:hypothetical protein